MFLKNYAAEKKIRNKKLSIAFLVNPVWFPSLRSKNAHSRISSSFEINFPWSLFSDEFRECFQNHLKQQTDVADDWGRHKDFSLKMSTNE